VQSRSHESHQTEHGIGQEAPQDLLEDVPQKQADPVGQQTEALRQEQKVP